MECGEGENVAFVSRTSFTMEQPKLCAPFCPSPVSDLGFFILQALLAEIMNR